MARSALPVLLLAAASVAQSPAGGAFVELPVPVGDDTQPAVLWVPEGEPPADGWPLILFLHGLGERGARGEHLDTGLPREIRRHPERFPALVLMPQCPRGAVWMEAEGVWARRRWESAERHVDAALAAVLERYPVDPGRVALTGLSMGGFGTFVYGAKHVDRFTRLAPVCGGGRLEDAEALARRPLWVLHGSADRRVPVEESRRMVEAVREAGGEVRYTEYEGVGHRCWDRAYGDPELIAWLLAPADEPAAAGTGEAAATKDGGEAGESGPDR